MGGSDAYTQAAHMNCRQSIFFEGGIEGVAYKDELPGVVGFCSVERFDEASTFEQFEKEIHRFWY